MTLTEKVKILRDATMCPMNKINDALKQANGDVDKAKELLTKEMSKTDLAEMANRQANATIVHSYVHSSRIGAMIAIACQTDFVARNETFLQLAKDICMHIVSTPIAPEYISEAEVPAGRKESWHNDAIRGLENKPAAVLEKIVAGKIKKQVDELCLLNQKFVKDETITVGQLIANVSAQTREKIEVKKFYRMVAS
jgi:elongation factor Ts